LPNIFGSRKYFPIIYSRKLNDTVFPGACGLRVYAGVFPSWFCVVIVLAGILSTPACADSLAASSAVPAEQGDGARPQHEGALDLSGSATAAGGHEGPGVVHIPFSALGAYRTLNLRGLEDIRSVNVGVRLDRMVKSARLRLTYAYSPSLLFAMSHLKVSINDEVVATLPFTAGNAGRSVTREIAIDPRLLTDYSQLQLRLIAHYSMDHCEDPSNSALWADISPTSEIVLDEAPIPLPNELALLPAPFFDGHDVNPLRLTFVLAPTANNATLRAAGIVASWFGALADYRNARFPVSSKLPEDDNAVIVGRFGELPAGLSLHEVDGPTLLVEDNPAAPGRKLLVVTGKSAADVDSAAYALVLRKPGLSGPLAKLPHIEPGPVRKPYDAPRWIPVDRPVQFTELIEHPEQLQVIGGVPESIMLNLRVPADLVSWNDAGVPVNLKYRYTAPRVQNNSALSVEMNQQLIKSYRLAPSDDKSGAGGALDTAQRSTTDLEIPPFLIGSSNELAVRFNLDSEKSTLCSGVATNPARAAIDPDSTIDFSRFVHYVSMPNLRFFSSSGFPYTRFADLSESVVVVPAHPTQQELEVMLTMLGHIGKWTGYPSLRVTLARPSQIAQLTDKDLLLIGGTPSAPLVTAWKTSVPVIGDRAAGAMQRTALSLDAGAAGTTSSAASAALAPAAPLQLSQSTPLAAVYGFQSPLSAGRTAIALVSSDADSLSALLDAFDSPSLVAQMHGDVMVVRHGSVESMQIGEPYFVGTIPWHARIWGFAMRHPVLLGALGVLAGLLLAVNAFNFLHRVAERRREM